METIGIEKAIKAAGSQKALADLVGVSQPTVWRWLHTAKKVSADFVLDVERVTGVSSSELNPKFRKMSEYDRGSRDTQ